MKSLSAIIISTLFSAAAFAQAGELDSTFSGDGKVTDYFPWNTTYGYVTAVAIQPDGKILLGGTMHVTGFSPFRWFIVRYNTDGSLDNSFGSNGMLVSIGETSAVVFSLTVQDDWKIVAVECSSDYYSTVRYNPDGSFDSSFSANSYFGSFNETAGALQSDDKIVVGGYIPPYNGFEIARYESNGSIDTSFNSDGFVTTSIGSESAVFSLAIQSDGKIIAAGYCNTGANNQFALARYNPGGTLDSSFNQDGIVTTAIDSTYGINSMVIQPDGKILVSDARSLYPDNDLTMVRYNPDGTLDTTFGTDGIVNIYSFKEAASFALQADGKIVVAGTSINYPISDFALICLNTDGTVDSSFGSNGVITTDFANSDDAANYIATQPDRKIVIAGSSDNLLALARYLSELNVGIINFSSSQASPLICPNPIRQTETLEYTLTQNESLTIALYDVNGKLMRNFISNEPRTAGSHKEQLNIGVLAAGNYFLTLSNGSQKMTVKMVKQ